MASPGFLHTLSLTFQILKILLFVVVNTDFSYSYCNFLPTPLQHTVRITQESLTQPSFVARRTGWCVEQHVIEELNLSRPLFFVFPTNKGDFAGFGSIKHFNLETEFICQQFDTLQSWRFNRFNQSSQSDTKFN